MASAVVEEAAEGVGEGAAFAEAPAEQEPFEAAAVAEEVANDARAVAAARWASIVSARQ
ncbi:hypothetical protein [Streptomyces echinatus]|uniref:hypothetical protein n=1 Tax=Streptomyces echinatus TaxID=67293 RepID=UPI0037A105B0